MTTVQGLSKDVLKPVPFGTVPRHQFLPDRYVSELNGSVNGAGVGV